MTNGSGSLDPTCSRIEPPGRRVPRPGPHPPFCAHRRLAPLSSRAFRSLRPIPCPWWGGATATSLIQSLGGLVGVDVVHGRRHPDDLLVDDRNGQVEPRIGEEFGSPARIDGVVGHVRCHLTENRGIAGAEQAYRRAHRYRGLSRTHPRISAYPGGGTAGSMFRIAAILQPPATRFNVIAVHISRSLPPSAPFWM